MSESFVDGALSLFLPRPDLDWPGGSLESALVICYGKQTAEIKAMDEMGDHFYLLDQLRPLLHQPELHHSGAVR